METAQSSSRSSLNGIEKARTGIAGLDEITGGGLPAGRPTLVCGGAGCGKTLFAMEFLVHGATEFGEPGVFMAFEETRRGAGAERPLARLRPRRARRARTSSSSTTSTSSAARSRRPASTTSRGCSSASGYAIDSIGAKRVVLDTIETLFAGLSNEAILRAELRRLFRWLKDKGVTAVITGERGDGHAHPPGPGGVRLRLRDPARPPGQRPGLDPPAAHRQVPRLAARHQRVPVPDRRATASASCRSPRSGWSTRRPTSGSPPASPRLDAMLGGKGYYRGSSVLVSGTAGTGKTSLAAHFADAACRRGERCLYFAFEESPGADRPQHALDRPRPAAVGRRAACCASTPRRPTLFGPGDAPGHHAHGVIRDFEPQRRDHRPDHQPARASARCDEVQAMLMRLIDFLKSRGRSPRCSPA